MLNQVGPGAATFVFSPSFIQGDPRSKLYTVVIRAHNGAAFAKVTLTIQVVDAGPQKPVFDTVPSNPSLVAGTVDSFIVHASDPDTMPVTLTASLSTLPTTFTFVDLGKGYGKLKVAPTFAQYGTYNVLIVAYNGTFYDSLTLVVNVIKAANQPPVLAPIANKTAKQLQGFNFLVTATDADGTFPQLLATNMPATATFTDHANGTGTFAWIPTLFDSGQFIVTFHAIDTDTTGLADSISVTLTVLDTVIAPFLYIGGSVTMNEGDTLRYAVSAISPDSTIPLLRAGLTSITDTLAKNMRFVDSGNGNGTLFFTPDYTQGNVGTQLFNLYYVKFFARARRDTTVYASSSPVQIRVNNKPAPPVLVFPNGAGPFTIRAGDSVQFNIGATDVDGGVITIATGPLPPNAVFTYGSLISTFKFKPDLTQVGTFNIVFTATSAANVSTSQTVTIVVTAIPNQPATISTQLPDTLNVPTQVSSQVVIQASDPEKQKVTIAASPVLPDAIFVDSGNGVAYYTVTPGTTDLGTLQTIRFIATDPQGLADTVSTTLRVVGFLRGDFDQNGKYTVADLSDLVNYLLRTGPPPVSRASADVNSDGVVDLRDISYLVAFLYGHGARPPQ